MTETQQKAEDVPELFLFLFTLDPFPVTHPAMPFTYVLLQ